MCYGNSVSWSDGGSWSSKSHKSSNSWKNYLVCDGCHNWVHEHRAQKKTGSCAKVVARRSSQQDLTQSKMPSCNLPTRLVAASISMPPSQRVSTCSRRILRLVCWRRCSKRPGGTMCLQLLGILLLLIANLSGIPQRRPTKLGKERATLRRRVRTWRQRPSSPESAHFS